MGAGNHDGVRSGNMDLACPTAGIAVRQGVGLHHKNGGEK